MLKKRIGGPSEDSGVIITAVVEPFPGHSDEEVVSRLARAGATVDVLTPGYISVQATAGVLRDIEAIASVRPKTLKQPRAATT